jgi:TP901 family phage tail tape measure protein
LKDVVIISKYSNTVEYNLKTTLDASGISKLQAEIRKTQDALRVLSAQELIGDKSASKAIQEIEKLQRALTTSFNSRVGMLDMNKFTAELTKSKTNLAGLQQEFAKAGMTGQTAFNQVIGRLGKLDTGVKSTSKAVDKIFNTIGNTVRWGVVSSAFNQMTNSIYQSVEYVKELDDSLTQIMLVTDYSRENMNDFARSANEAAKNLGSTTTAMTNASLVFAQQGFNLDQSSQLAELSTKLANASQQDTATTSDQITAYMNAYGLDKDMNALHGAMDAWAQVANVSAADVAELAQASQKAASTANTVGVSMDQLNGQIAAIESVTREAPEQIGNGLKTLYARFSDLEAGETLEDGVSLGKVTSQLEKYGVQVLDGEGQMRGVGDIMEDLMEVWSSLDQTQKAAVAQTVAGKYQLSRFEALMNRSDLYDEYKGASESADGTLDQMNEEFVDSLEGRMNKLQATFEGIFNSLFETDDIYPFIDALTAALELVDNFVQSIGGGGQVLLAFGNIATKVFSKQLAENITNTIQAYTDNKAVKANSKMVKQNLESLGLKDTENKYNKPIVDFATTGMKYSNIMSDNQKTNFNDNLEQTLKLNNQVLESEAKLREAAAATNLLYQDRLETKENMLSIEKDENGNLSWKIGEQLMPQFAAGTALGMEDAKAYENYDLSDSLEGSISALDNLSNQVEGYISLQKQVDKDNAWDKVKGNIDITRESVKKLCSVMTGLDDITAVKDLDKAMEDAGQEAKEMAQAIQKFMSATDITTGKELDVNKIKSAIEEITTLALTEQKAMEGLGKGNFIQNPEDLNRLLEMFNKAKVAADEQARINAETQKGLKLQAKLNNVIELTSAVGDLAFAWTSFQELGSLWAKEDLSLGEKVLQTITNMAFVIPQLITAMRAFNLTKIENQVAETAIGLLDAAQGAGKLAKGADIAGTAMAKFSDILTLLIPHGKAIKVVLGGLAAALAFVGFTSGQEKARVAALAKSAEEASTKLQNIQEGKANFDSIYEQYKKGQASSSELEDAAKTLNDTLNDQSLVVQSLAGNWEAYSQSVDAAAKKEAQAQQNTLKQNSWEAERSYATKASSWDTLVGPKNNSLSAKMQMDEGVANTYLNQNAIGKDLFGGWGVMDGSTAADRIQALNDINDAYVEAIANASGKQKEVLQEEYDNFTTFASKFDEEKTAVESAWNAEAQGALAAFGDEKDFQLQSGETLEEYKQRLLETGKFSSEGAVEAFVEGMASGDFSSSEAIANAIGAKSADKSFEEISQGAISRDIDNGNINFGQGFSANAEINETSLQNYVTQEYNNLSDEQKIKLVGTLDKNATTQEILQQIQEIQNGPELEQAELEFKPNFTNRVDLSEADYSQIAQDSGISDTTFNRMAADTYHQEGGYFQEESAKIESQIKDIQDGSVDFKEVVEGAENADEAVSQLKEDYNDLAKEAKDVTAANLRMNKGVDSLIDCWEEAGAVLKDDAAKGTADWYKAVEQVDEAMSDILNIDVGTLSNDFYENADAIAAMEQAAQGDMAALDELRDLATKDIIQNMDIQIGSGDEEGVEAARTKLLELQQSLQNELDNTPLEARAKVDVSEYTAQLNQMIMDGQITAEQASQALSSMGISGEITYEQGQIDAPIITYTNQGGSLDSLLNENGGSISFTSAVTGHTTVDAQIPQFKGTHYTGAGITGGVGRGSTKKGSGGGGGKKGGGGGGKKGGGGGKSYKPKENKDAIENKVDRYEKVNTALAAIGADYEKINSEQERLTGDKLAKNLQKQNELLLRQIELYQEKLKIQQQEAEEVKNKLSSQFGITYDSEGFMINYAKVHQQLIDEVNRIGNQYAGLGSEEAEEALDKQYEAAQKRLDTFEELYQRYDELLSSDLKDTIQQIEDLKDSIEDMRIEIFKTSIQALDNIKEIRKELAEFNQSSKIWFDNDPFEKAKESILQLGEFWDGAIDDVDKYYDELIAKEQEAANKATTSEGKLYHNNRILQLQKAKADQGKESLDYLGTGFFDMQFSNVMDMMKEIEEFEKTGSSTVFGENSAAMYETALDVLKQANSTLNDYKDNVTELRDLINDMLDEILEKQEERQNMYENINDELEHQIDLITIIHGEEAYDQLKQAYAAQLTNTKNQISEMNQTLAANKELLAQMEAAGDTSSDAYKALKENIADTQKELNSLVQSSIENIRKQQELAVKSITDAWVKDALGTDLDWMQTEWELINRNADYYLDDVNKAYNIQKLQGKYLELLDQSNDLGIQNQITAQMKEQLKYLREKKNLSEYDVQYANAQLEILQKRIALEEAQRNKSQMKLRRDSQGNYSYVYTANEGDVANAQSGLLDAQNNAYNLSKEQMKQTQADSLSALADAKSLIDSIWTNANLSLEEKKKRTETIIGSLKEYLTATSEQLGVSEQNIINDFLGMCEALTDENKTGLQETYEEIVNGNKDAFDKIDDRWSTSLTGWLENLDKFNQDTTDKFDSLYGEMEEYESEIDNIGDLVGQNFDDMTGSIQGTLNKTEELRTSTQGFISDLQKMSGAVADAEKSMAYYRDKITEANNEMSMYQQKVNELGSKLEQAEREKADMRAEIQKMQDAEAARQQAANGGNGAGGAGGGGGANGQANSAMAWGIAQAIWTYGGKSGWGNDPIRSTKLKKAYGDAFAREVQNVINSNARSGKLVNYDSMKYSSYSLIGYDTGGYTGTWGDKTFDDKNGKLAVLHQKELILNATDTENILATVSAVRDLVAGLKAQALNGLSTAFAIGGVATKETAQDVNQNVHITAEFPNVSSSSEIENALLNLNERAIQYAFKNN